MATERELRLHAVIAGVPTRRQRQFSQKVIDGVTLPSDIDLTDREQRVIVERYAADIATEDALLPAAEAATAAGIAAMDAALALLAEDTAGDSVAATITLLEAAGGTSPA